MKDLPKSILEAFEEFNAFYYMNNQKDFEKGVKENEN